MAAFDKRKAKQKQSTVFIQVVLIHFIKVERILEVLRLSYDKNINWYPYSI